MASKVVAMTAIRGSISRGSRARSDLSYLPYARATWEWWCRQRDIEFVLVERTACAPPDTYPTIQRWHVPAELLGSRAPGTRIAMVDADTMVRWDAPDMFDLAEDSFAAVNAGHRGWVGRSINAFQPYFPDVRLAFEEYFNCGLLVLNGRHLAVLSAFLTFYQRHRPQLEATFKSADVGTDQTIMNFIVKQERERVRLLDRAFNVLHCVGGRADYLKDFERSDNPRKVDATLLMHPATFGFIDNGYVWHFTNSVSTRAKLMAETWHRVRKWYS